VLSPPVDDEDDDELDDELNDELIMIWMMWLFWYLNFHH